MLKVEFYGDAHEVISDMKLFLRLNPLDGNPPVTSPASSETEAVTTSEPVPETEAPKETAKPQETSARKFGESDWDKSRRTKEQMATDKEIEELAAALNVEINKTVPADRLVMQLREQSASGANISTSPEDRKDPSEEALTGEIVEYTLDDVREKLGEYAAKFGMAAAQQEGPKLLGAAKISEIADTPEARKAAVDNLTAAIEADING